MTIRCASSKRMSSAIGCAAGAASSQIGKDDDKILRPAAPAARGRARRSPSLDDEPGSIRRLSRVRDSCRKMARQHAVEADPRHRPAALTAVDRRASPPRSRCHAVSLGDLRGGDTRGIGARGLGRCAPLRIFVVVMGVVLVVGFGDGASRSIAGRMPRSGARSDVPTVRSPTTAHRSSARARGSRR